MDTPPCSFVILGVTGDLASRKLLPALYALHREGELHPETRIIGYARSDLGDEGLRERLGKAVKEYSPDFDEATWRELAGRISYQQGGYDNAEGYRGLAQALDDAGAKCRVFYTATPPSTYEGIVRGLHDAGLSSEPEGGFSRIVIEKPFGDDLESAVRLNRLLLDRFGEDQIYRIDHYLAKETAQNVAVLRFANTLFEPTWNNRYVDHVQVTMAESVGMEGRGSFYEEAGVIRDVFQNHLLQLVALVAMEPPARYDARSVRNEKVKVFEAMACPDPARAVLGQYTAAGAMPGYREEQGVAPDSRQATFAAVQFGIHNWRWEGVPFFVRSGKRLDGKSTEIVLRYRLPPHMPFDLPAPVKADRLVMRLAPDEGISIHFNVKDVGQDLVLDRPSLDFSYSDQLSGRSPDAYETLLLDVMQGDATLFMRSDEVEAQWRIVEPLLDTNGPRGPAPYPAGSSGPAAAYELLAHQGRHWFRPSHG